MMPPDRRSGLSRRAFLGTSLSLGGAAALLGCGDAEPARTASGRATDGGACPDPFAGGQRVGVVPFVDENGDLPLDERIGEGWDGRLYTDLSTLEPDHPLVDNDRFYIRTHEPDLLDRTAPWVVRARGLVEVEQDIPIDGILADARPIGTHALECSGNSRGGAFGLMSAAAWGGVPMTEILDRLGPSEAATHVLVSGFDEHSVPSVNGHSTPGASWVFSFADLEAAGAFLATEMNGEPLPPDHGSPVRLFVPGWYGCCNVKWVDEIRLVDEAEPATSQMVEFASRTHQPRAFALARDYLPATMDQAAMPVRVERWRVDGALVHRVVGVLWGGYQATDALEVRFGDGPYEAVDVCPPMVGNQTWTLWSHRWVPDRVGTHDITCRIADPSIPTRRLDVEYYLRVVDIDTV